MVRNYKRRMLGTFSEENMREAVKLVLGSMSLRNATEQKLVKVSNISQVCKETKNDLKSIIRMCPRYDCRLVFNKNQEKQLVNYLIECSKMCYGLSNVECKKFAYELAKKKKK